MSKPTAGWAVTEHDGRVIAWGSTEDRALDAARVELGEGGAALIAAGVVLGRYRVVRMALGGTPDA